LYLTATTPDMQSFLLSMANVDESLVSGILLLW
jgi:hypothetical protein